MRKIGNIGSALAPLAKAQRQWVESPARTKFDQSHRDFQPVAVAL